jgi:chaperonin cofactor prefoldin
VPETNVDDGEIGRAVGDITISYTVRELLQRLEERLIRMETRTEQVATKTDLKVLEDKVDALESYRDKILEAAIAVSALSGGGVAYLMHLFQK